MTHSRSVYIYIATDMSPAFNQVKSTTAWIDWQHATDVNLCTASLIVDTETIAAHPIGPGGVGRRAHPPAVAGFVARSRGPPVVAVESHVGGGVRTEVGAVAPAHGPHPLVVFLALGVTEATVQLLVLLTPVLGTGVGGSAEGVAARQEGALLVAEAQVVLLV